MFFGSIQTVATVIAKDFPPMMTASYKWTVPTSIARNPDGSLKQGLEAPGTVKTGHLGPISCVFNNERCIIKSI
jgi:hypothetical protein